MNTSLTRRALFSVFGFVVGARAASATQGIPPPCAVCQSNQWEELGSIVGGQPASTGSDLNRLVTRRDRPMQLCLVCWTMRVKLLPQP